MEGRKTKMNIHFIKSGEKREIIAQLNKQFGIEDLPYLLIESGKEKIRAFSGTMSKEEILELNKMANIEAVGIYLIKKEHDLRLSFDATQILKDQIKKKVVEISKEQYELWIRGYDLPIATENGAVVIKFQDSFIGCGRSNGERIINHVPKERRLKIPIRD
ncbi:MAG: hypothetical protein AABW80_05275 [Nanoarchaeota archaeon]